MNGYDVFIWLVFFGFFAAIGSILSGIWGFTKSNIQKDGIEAVRKEYEAKMAYEERKRFYESHGEAMPDCDVDPNPKIKS
jgi:hypothetical protein